MSKELTEKYGFGKLPDGWYYVHLTTPSGIDITPILEMPMGEKYFRDFDERGYEIEVLAPVPSYEKVKHWDECANKIMYEVEKLQKQLAIATKALEQFKKREDDYLDYGIDEDGNQIALHPNRVATKALKEIEEVK